MNPSNSVSNTLISFINDEDDFIKGIKEETNLGKLTRFLEHNDVDQDRKEKIRTFTREYLNEHMDRLLSLNSDLIGLGKLYSNSYWLCERVLGPKIITRMREICRTKSLEELLKIREKFFSGCSTRPFVDIIEESIIEQLKKDPRSDTFSFLIDIWKKFMDHICVGDGPTQGALNVEKLAQEIIAVEKDLDNLKSWSGDCELRNHRSTNTIRREITARKKELITVLLPTSDEATQIYSYFSGSFSDTFNLKIDRRLAEVIMSDIATMGFDGLFEYRKKFGLHPWFCKCPDTRKVFADRMDEILPKTITAFSSATQAYEHIKLVAEFYEFDNRFMHGYDGFPKLLPIIERCIELTPIFFKTNPDLRQALIWYRYSRSEKIQKAMEPIIGSIINEEQSAEVLRNVEKNEPFLKLAEERFGILLRRLKAPTTWFEKYIENKSFFGNKEIFLMKAKEFVAE